MAGLVIKRNGTVIDSKYKTVRITKELDHRGSKISFKTENDFEEWDDIDVRDGSGNLLFAGVAEKIIIDSPGNGVIERTVLSTGYKRLFDMKRIAQRYSSMLAGDIVKDIISNWTEDFTEGTIEDGITFDDVVFNYKSPSDALSQLASGIGFLWKINNDKTVDFFVRTKDAAPQTITDSSSNFRGLSISPEVSELTNSVIVRGGTFLSTEQSFKDVGNSEKTQFILPEKPHDISVEVNSVAKTVGTKIEGATPITDFVVNFQEKYLENGTHAVLTASDTVEVLYKYDVPLRIRRKDHTSVAAMAAIFPLTDGVFENIIEDETIESRDLAKKVADEYLGNYSNAVIKGSFKTYESIFEPGEVLTINAKGISNSAVIEKVIGRSVVNGFFEYQVFFATVLFDFEDFLRMLLTRGSLDLNDSDVVENIENVSDEMRFSEEITVSTDQNRVLEEIEFSESIYLEKNASIQYVLGPYFPTSHTDTKRAFILDSSPLA